MSVDDNAKPTKKLGGVTGKGFMPGKSGNPGGMHATNPLFRERARKAVDDLVLKAWIEEVEKRGKEWAKCSELLAAYGYGKPSSSPEDLEAARAQGVSVFTSLTRDEVLAIARGEKP